MSQAHLTLASEAWHLLKGLVCIHKPAFYSMGSLIRQLKMNVIMGLNAMDRSHDADRHPNDYSLHPLVIGPGFDVADVHVLPVNPLQKRSSGLLLLAVNNSGLAKALRSMKMPSTYRVGMKLGEATDNSFVTGRLLEKSTYAHIENRPQVLDRLLASIRAAHQREAYRSANVNLQTQEAYNLAVLSQGLPRPKNYTGTLIMGLKCTKFAPPLLDLEMMCINENEDFMCQLIAEIGLNLKTNAVCTGIHCLRHGFFSNHHSLLLKHTQLDHVLENIAQTRHIVKLNGGLNRASLPVGITSLHTNGPENSDRSSSSSNSKSISS